jgi:hypothetical protein
MQNDVKRLDACEKYWSIYSSHRPGKLNNSKCPRQNFPGQNFNDYWSPVRGKLRQPTGPFFRRQRSFEIPTNDGKEGRKSDTVLFIFDSAIF